MFRELHLRRRRPQSNKGGVQAFDSGSSLVRREENTMFGWAIAFLIIALIAGALGFGVVAGTALAPS